MNDQASANETAEVAVRVTKEQRELMIALIGTLADDYMKRFGAVYPSDRRPIWHFIDHIAVKWKVVNPFRLEPGTESLDEAIARMPQYRTPLMDEGSQVNKEENGDQQEENKGPA